MYDTITIVEHDHDDHRVAVAIATERGLKMKWNTAIKQIEQAMAEGKKVGVEYHRKWARNGRQFDAVYSVGEYVFNGEVCEGVTTYYDILDEDNYIIDGIVINDTTVTDYKGREVNFEAAVALMDDEIREALHEKLAPCTNQEFFEAYEEAHLEKYGSEFEAI